MCIVYSKGNSLLLLYLLDNMIIYINYYLGKKKKRESSVLCVAYMSGKKHDREREAKRVGKKRRDYIDLPYSFTLPSYSFTLKKWASQPTAPQRTTRSSSLSTAVRAGLVAPSAPSARPKVSPSSTPRAVSRTGPPSKRT